MTHWMRPPEFARARERDQFDPVIEGARYGLSRELSLATWERVCADATDSIGRLDADQAQRRFHDIAVRIQSRGGRLRPDVGRLTRVQTEILSVPRGTWPIDELAPRTPGRTTRVIAEMQRLPAYNNSLSTLETAGGEMARPELPGASEVKQAIAALQASLPDHSPVPDHGLLRDEAEVEGAPLQPFAEALAQGGGQPVDPSLRAVAEVRLGRDLRHVRVHTDALANRAVTAIGANAFTRGTHIWLGPGRSAFDRRLMLHELTHVVQQAEGRAAGLSGLGGEPSVRRALEAEAEGIAHGGGVMPRMASEGATAVIAPGARGTGAAGTAPVQADAESDPAPLLAGPLDQLTDEQIEREVALLRAWLHRSSIVENDYPRVIATLQQLEQIALRHNARHAPRRAAPPHPHTHTDPGPRETLNPRSQSDAALATRAAELQRWMVAHPQVSSGSPEAQIYEENAAALHTTEEEAHRRTRAAAEARTAQFGGATDEMLRAERAAIVGRPFTGNEAPARVAAIDRELEQRVSEHAAARRDEFSRRRRGQAYYAIRDPDTCEVIGYGFIGTLRSERGNLYVYDLEGREVYRRPEFITGPTSEPIDPIDMFGPMLVRGGARLGTRLVRGLIRVGDAAVEAAVARLVQNEALTALRASMARSLRGRVLGAAMTGGEAIPALRRGAAGLMGSAADRGAISAVVESGERSAVSSAGNAVETEIAAEARAPESGLGRAVGRRPATVSTIASEAQAATSVRAPAPEATLSVRTDGSAAQPAPSPFQFPTPGVAVDPAPIAAPALPPMQLTQTTRSPSGGLLFAAAEQPSAPSAFANAGGSRARVILSDDGPRLMYRDAATDALGLETTYNPQRGVAEGVSFTQYAPVDAAALPARPSQFGRASIVNPEAQLSHASYTNTFFERGHLAARELVRGMPLAQRRAALRVIDRMFNIVPMAGRGATGVNQGIWRDMERRVMQRATQLGQVRVRIRLHFGAPDQQIPFEFHVVQEDAYGHVLEDTVIPNQ